MFDPEWAVSKVADDVIVQSNEGVCFHISMDLLAKHSSFFAGLATLPTPTLIYDRDRIIELPSASTKSLQIALSLLVNDNIPAWFANQRGDVCTELVYHSIRDLVTFTDIYDFPELLKEVSPYIRSDWLRYAIAAINADEDSARSISATIVRDDRPFRATGFPTHEYKLLEEFAPLYRVRLQNLLDNRRSAWTTCKVGIRHTTPAFNGFGYFGQKCCQGRVCSAFLKYNGSFKALRRRAAYVAIGAMECTTNPDRRIGPTWEAVQ